MWIKLKKIVLLVFVFLLFSTAVVMRFVSPVVAQGTIYGTIYIRADGSIDPPIANITSVDNVTYTLTADLHASIVVERDNIVVEGANFTLQGIGYGAGYGIGIVLPDRSNVTIRNMKIREFYIGIYLYYSLNNNLSRNNMAGNYYGIWLNVSSNNNFSGNNIINSINGIWLSSSSYNNFSGNNIINNGYGIWLSESSYNTISGNNVTNNINGIWLDGSSYNMFRNNDVSNKEYNFGVYGSLLPEFIQDIDDSNTVNGKPVYYWVNRRDMAVPLDAGWIALIGCTRITVKNLNLTDNGQGMLLSYTTNSTITKNNITKNINGIWLFGSSNNTINENTITENAGNGIYLFQSSNNLFFHNYFINNTRQVSTSQSKGVWDNGVKGNYWSDYEDKYPNATELDDSGMWDTPYVIDENNQDNYPLMNYRGPPLISIVSPENKTYTVGNVSLTFTVSEPTSWMGYSLDGKAIATIAGNTTLTELSDGLHSLKVYAKDTDGNTGTSKTIYFSIKTQQPFPTTWIVAIIAIIVAVGAALLVYFIKVKKTTGKPE